ncbi:MAG TPA: universal stress protein [Pyrinomonadaceae bacterium]
MSFQTQQVQMLNRSLQTKADASADRNAIKVLIPFDGSENSGVALSELRRAGLPEHFEVFLGVTDVWLPSSPYEITRAVSARRLSALTAGMSSFVPALSDYEEHRVLLRDAEERVRSTFPTATISSEALQSEAAVSNEVIRKAKQWGADLIVVGSKTSPSPHITDYAGPALKISREAHCSVRIARICAQHEDSPTRLIIALETPESSEHLVERVAERHWPSETEVHLVLLRKPGPHDQTQDLKENAMLEQLARPLREIGLRVFVTTLTGQPKEILLSKARELAVDCVFIDAAGTNAIEGSLGAVAQVLVLGAHCSVEVVRSGSLNPTDFKPAA